MLKQAIKTAVIDMIVAYIIKLMFLIIAIAIIWYTVTSYVALQKEAAINLAQTKITTVKSYVSETYHNVTDTNKTKMSMFDTLMNASKLPNHHLINKETE